MQTELLPTLGGKKDPPGQIYMIKISQGKLIRDKIPQILKAKEITTFQIKKRKKSGGFKKRLFLISTNNS